MPAVHPVAKGAVMRWHPWSLTYLKMLLVCYGIRSLLEPLMFIGTLLEPKLPSNVKVLKTAVPSRDKGRTIKVHIYSPKNVDRNKKYPVVINFHGSGFVLPSLGQDRYFCAQLASRLDAVVVDSDYSKAPRRPYPHAPEDTEDVAAWVLSRPSTLPPVKESSLTLTGFSAGGNIANVLALRLGPDRVAGLATFYGPSEMHYDPMDLQLKVPPRPTFKAGVRLPKNFNILARQSYIVHGTDDNAPGVSPIRADASAFPKVVAMTAGDGDKLHDDSVRLIKKLEQANHPDATFLSIEHGGHGFDKVPRTAVAREMRATSYEFIFQAVERAFKYGAGAW